MRLLLLLLLAAEWLAPGFAWPHNETVATGPLLDDPSNWPQSKPTDTGLAHGERTDPPPTNTVPEGFTKVGTLLIELKPTDGGLAQGELRDESRPTDTHREDFIQAGTDSIDQIPSDIGLTDVEWPHERRTNGLAYPGWREQQEQLKSKCVLWRQRILKGNKLVWEAAEDHGQQECMDYCATQTASNKAAGKLSNSMCWKDETPYTDVEGNVQTGS
jgi:hypothetical protein